MAFQLVTTEPGFSAMLQNKAYLVKMEEVGCTYSELLYTTGFGPCMVLVVHQGVTHRGALAHLWAPFGDEGTYLRERVSSILENLKINPNAGFDIALIEGMWGKSPDIPDELRQVFKASAVLDRRAVEYRLLNSVVLYDPSNGNLAHYSDIAGASDPIHKAPYAKALLVRNMKSPYPTWQLNEQAAACTNCKTAFGVTTWRHHCRKCGLIFCDACSSHKKKVTYPASRNQEELIASIDKEIRVCDKCFRQ
jgi:hypothetical protein